MNPQILKDHLIAIEAMTKDAADVARDVEFIDTLIDVVEMKLNEMPYQRECWVDTGELLYQPHFGPENLEWKVEVTQLGFSNLPSGWSLVLRNALSIKCDWHFRSLKLAEEIHGNRSNIRTFDPHIRIQAVSHLPALLEEMHAQVKADHTIQEQTRAYLTQLAELVRPQADPAQPEATA